MSIKIANTVVISDTKDLENLNNAEFEDNGFITLPSGNTAQRPVSPSGGMLRYNTDINDFEIYSNDEWTVFEEDTENLKDSIKYDEASVNVNFPAAFQITDYDIEREYILSSNTGTVSRVEDTIIFTANTSGTVGFSINGRDISIQAINTPLVPGGTIAPYTGSLPADGSWVDYTEGLSKYILGASDNISVNTISEKDYTIIRNVDEGYNITSSGLTGSLGVSNEGDIYFKPNGLALYVLADNLVHQYDLSTSWDLNSLSKTGTFDLQSEINDNHGISFRPDGTKMYVLGTTTNVSSRVFQYTLSTPWDVSTASYDSVEFIASQGSGPGGMFFKPDGLNLFVVSNYDTTNRKVVDYSLSTAWDLSTASTSNTTSLSISSYISTGLTFSSDGKVLFLVESDDIVQFTLSTAWDLSTASFYSDNDVSSRSYLGVTIKSDDTKLYAINSSAEIQELVLSGGVTTNTIGSHTGSLYTYTSGSYPYMTGTFSAGAHSHTVTISSIDSDLKRKSYKLAKCVSASPLPSNIYILSDSNLSGLSPVDVEETHMLFNTSSESSAIEGDDTLAMTLTTNSAGSHAHGPNGTPVYSGSEPYYWSDASDGSHSHTTSYNNAGNDNTKKRTFSLWSDANETVGVISGSIMLWDSDTPPAGWVICDGTNGTPDMRDRYLSISNTASHGVSTGDNVVTFSGLTTSSAGSHRHYSGQGGTVGDPTQSGRHINFAGNHPHTINTFSARIRPEYHALHFIKKL